MNFDDEGTDSNCNILIEKGILKGYMQDKQNAMLPTIKLATAPKAIITNRIPFVFVEKRT